MGVGGKAVHIDADLREDRSRAKVLDTRDRGQVNGEHQASQRLRGACATRRVLLARGIFPRGPQAFAVPR